MSPEKQKILRSHVVLDAVNLRDLEIEITEYLDEGWVLHGQMQIIPSSAFTWQDGTVEYGLGFYQQMVKTDPISLGNRAKTRMDEEYGEGW